jgi:hypothetical protein
MNKFFVTTLLTLLPLALMAQAPVKEPDQNPATTKVKVKVKVRVKAKAKPLTKSRIEIKSTAVQMATGIRAAEAAMTLVELAIAERVYQGRLPCELGAFVTLTADASAPGYFDLQINKLKYRMFPVISSTGAIRLEDPQAGAVWIQLANKSMLMNQKLGQRLADDCMNPDQAMVAEAMLKNPPPSLLEAPLETVTSTKVTIQ